MPLRNIVIIAVVIIASLTCQSAVSRTRYANLYTEAIGIIHSEALLKANERQLFEDSIAGMLTKFDRNSVFLHGREYAVMEEDLQQKFGGVGMFVDAIESRNRLFVLAPMPNSPASRAGLVPGDEILAIDDEEVNATDRSRAVELMRGLDGTTVKLSILRNNEPKEILINRESIPVASVHGDWLNPDGRWDFFLKDNPRMGYIRVLQFGENTTKEMRDALQAISTDVDGLIIDLRNNPGGLLTCTLEICDMFLPDEKVILETRGREGVVEKRYETTAPVEFPMNIPIAILVDRQSASASEIISACLQDHQRAIVVGERSYGKGTVQNVFPLERGKSAIKLTTATYWRPSQKNIDRTTSELSGSKDWGVSPDPEGLIQMEAIEVVEVYRHRYLRDLQGILEAHNFVLDDSMGVSQPITDIDLAKPNDELLKAKQPSEAFVYKSDRVLERAVELLKQK